MNPDLLRETTLPPTPLCRSALRPARHRRRLAVSLAAAALGVTALASSCASARPRPGAPLRAAVGPWEMQVLVEGAPVETYAWNGGTYVLGHQGERYTVRILNHSGRRIEAVASIDGRDVVDGQRADFQKRGYLVPAWGSVDIEGWRLSGHEAAAFRFSSVASSYAAQMGEARDVGVVGVAIFPERMPERARQALVAPRAEPTPSWDLAPLGANESSADRSAPSESRAGAGAARSAAPAAPRAAAKAEAEARSDARPGLGTEFGERVSSEIREVTFTRAAGIPAALLGARYNDREGLLALGIDVDHTRACSMTSELDRRQSASPFPGEPRYAVPPPGWRAPCPVRY